MNRLINVFSIILFYTLSACVTAPTKLHVIYDKSIPQLQFAIDEFKNASSAANLQFVEATDTNAVVVEFAIDESLGREAYSIAQQNKTIRVRGGDANGLMYAGLELAENLQAGKNLLETGMLSGEPYMPYRGIKFNIPLDARNPSYDDTGDAAQENIATMWEFSFWKNYLDNMARYRYNLLTLWSLHPYPSMVKVPGYEDVALADVCVYTNPITSKTNMKWRDEDIHNPEYLRTVKKMTIDEKITFWKEVFQYAQDRGIDIHMYHWNVFVNGAEGKYGIETRQDSPETVDYMRESVKQFLLTYPTVKGIGVTAGENINRNIKGKYATENWMWLTYGKAIMEAKAINPEIDITFTFRQHHSDLDLIANAFKDFSGAFDTEFKYSRARMFSSVKPSWFDRIYREQVEKYQMKVWMNVRNDDIFNFRWGNPEYANAYIKNMPKNLMSGYFWGPDGYLYGRDFTSKDPEGLPKYEIDKHWYLFMIWGRAGYNPDLPESFYKDRIAARFPGADADLVYHTWKATSDVIEWVDKIHFRQNDAEFLAEGSIDINRFKNLNSFARNDCMPDQGLTAIGDFAQYGEVEGELTPFDVSDRLDEASAMLLTGAAKLRAGDNREFAQTIADFKSMGYLAQYYAHKIRGATHMARFRFAGDDQEKKLSVAEMEQAVTAWTNYAKSATEHYKPQLFARTMLLDWDALTEFVKEDVNIARNAKQGEPVAVSASNRLWERDRRMH